MTDIDYRALIQAQDRQGAECARQAAKTVLHPAFGADSIRFDMAKDYALAMREADKRIDDLLAEWKIEQAAARDQKPGDRS